MLNESSSSGSLFMPLTARARCRWSWGYEKQVVMSTWYRETYALVTLHLKLFLSMSIQLIHRHRKQLLLYLLFILCQASRVRYNYSCALSFKLRRKCDQSRNCTSITYVAFPHTAHSPWVDCYEREYDGDRDKGQHDSPSCSFGFFLHIGCLSIFESWLSKAKFLYNLTRSLS